METQQGASQDSGGQCGAPATGQHAMPTLRRSRSDRVIAGICGGLGRYLGVDPVVVRIAWVALTLAAGTGLLLYIIAWIVIPEEREDEAVVASTHVDGSTARIVVGGALLVFGALLLFNRLAPWFDARLLWSLVLIGIGLLVITRGAMR